MKEMRIQDKEEISESSSTELSYTNADVTNRVFTMSYRFVKHIRGYELLQKVKNCKVFVQSFFVPIWNFNIIYHFE